jgi:hypothetical protein
MHHPTRGEEIWLAFVCAACTVVAGYCLLRVFACKLSEEELRWRKAMRERTPDPEAKPDAYPARMIMRDHGGIAVVLVKRCRRDDAGALAACWGDWDSMNVFKCSEDPDGDLVLIEYVKILKEPEYSPGPYPGLLWIPEPGRTPYTLEPIR